MEVGVSTACFYPLETEEALSTLCSLNIGLAELFFNAPQETLPAFTHALRRTANAAGVRICAVHPYSSGSEPFYFFSDYRRRFEDALELYKGFYEAANVLGAEIVALHGDRMAGSLPDEAYYERFGELSLHARRHGVVLAQENVAYCKSRSAAFIRGMREYLGGEAAFVLDTKQAVRAGESAMELLEAMGENVVHLHLSDSDGAERDCLPPGEGSFDFTAFARRLHALGYTGNGVVELYRGNYGEYGELAASRRHLEEIFAREWRTAAL